MNSIYASDQFCQVIWPDFTVHFRNKSTEASYRTDVIEFMSIYQMDFLQITDGTVEDYYAKMQEKVEAGLVQPSTMAKKFREHLYVKSGNVIRSQAHSRTISSHI